MPEERAAEDRPQATFRIRPTEARPTAAEVTATLARLGIDVKWSEEAVEQLLEAAAAADEYLRAFPDQAETLARDPETVLRDMADKGILSKPVDALLPAFTATRKKTSSVKPADNPFRLADVVFQDLPERSSP